MLCLQEAYHEAQSDTKLPFLWLSSVDFCASEMPKPQQAVTHHWRPYQSIHWEEVLEADKDGTFRLCHHYVEKEKTGISYTSYGQANVNLKVTWNFVSFIQAGEWDRHLCTLLCLSWLGYVRKLHGKKRFSLCGTFYVHMEQWVPLTFSTPTPPEGWSASFSWARNIYMVTQRGLRHFLEL